MATLDKKLKDLRSREEAAAEGEGAGKARKRKASAAKSGGDSCQPSADLFGRAGELLGDYLVKEFYESEEADFPPGAKAFLRDIAPYVLTAEPVSTKAYSTYSTVYGSTYRPGGKEKHMKYSFADAVDSSTLRMLLSAMGGEALAESMLPSLKDADTMPAAEVFDKCLPGHAAWSAIEDALESCGCPDMDPYLLPLAMAPASRPLVAVAIGIGIEKGDILSGKQLDDLQESGSEFKMDLLSCTPTLAHLAEAAKRYGVTDLEPVIEDLNRVVALYIKKWG